MRIRKEMCRFVWRGSCLWQVQIIPLTSADSTFENFLQCRFIWHSQQSIPKWILVYERIWRKRILDKDFHSQLFKELWPLCLFKDTDSILPVLNSKGIRHFFYQRDGYCKELMIFIDFKENLQEYKVQVFVESLFSP